VSARPSARSPRWVAARLPAKRVVPVLLTVLLLAGWFTGRGAYALLNAVDGSPGRIGTGTVVLSDDDAGGAIVSLASAHPGDTSIGCILVSYTGSMDASTRLYSTVSGGLGPYVTLIVTRGTVSAPSFNSCASFVADAPNYIGAGQGVVYSGTLSSYPANWSSGILDPPSSPQTWHTGDAHAYRIQVTLTNDAGAQGLSASVTFDWEAHNL
jgi:hypothetical protein